jgi:hypothetical protein
VAGIRPKPKPNSATAQEISTQSYSTSGPNRIQTDVLLLIDINGDHVIDCFEGVRLVLQACRSGALIELQKSVINTLTMKRCLTSGNVSVNVSINESITNDKKAKRGRQTIQISAN